MASRAVNTLDIDEAYRVLGWSDRNFVPTLDELSARYKELMRRNHPDKNSHPRAADISQLINQARDVVRQSLGETSFASIIQRQRQHQAFRGSVLVSNATSGETVRVDASSDMTVEALREKSCRILGIDPRVHRLYFGHVELRDGRNLLTYGVGNNTNLLMETHGDADKRMRRAKDLREDANAHKHHARQMQQMGDAFAVFGDADDDKAGTAHVSQNPLAQDRWPLPVGVKERHRDEEQGLASDDAASKARRGSMEGLRDTGVEQQGRLGPWTSGWAAETHTTRKGPSMLKDTAGGRARKSGDVEHGEYFSVLSASRMPKRDARKQLNRAQDTSNAYSYGNAQESKKVSAAHVHHSHREALSARETLSVDQVEQREHAAEAEALSARETASGAVLRSRPLSDHTHAEQALLPSASRAHPNNVLRSDKTSALQVHDAQDSAWHSTHALGVRHTHTEGVRLTPSPRPGGIYASPRPGVIYAAMTSPTQGLPGNSTSFDTSMSSAALPSETCISPATARSPGTTNTRDSDDTASPCKHLSPRQHEPSLWSHRERPLSATSSPTDGYAAPHSPIRERSLLFSHSPSNLMPSPPRAPGNLHTPPKVPVGSSPLPSEEKGSAASPPEKLGQGEASKQWLKRSSPLPAASPSVYTAARRKVAERLAEGIRDAAEASTGRLSPAYTGASAPMQEHTRTLAREQRQRDAATESPVHKHNTPATLTETLSHTHTAVEAPHGPEGAGRGHGEALLSYDNMASPFKASGASPRPSAVLRGQDDNVVTPRRTGGGWSFAARDGNLASPQESAETSGFKKWSTSPSEGSSHWSPQQDTSMGHREEASSYRSPLGKTPSGRSKVDTNGFDYGREGRHREGGGQIRARVGEEEEFKRREAEEVLKLREENERLKRENSDLTRERDDVLKMLRTAQRALACLGREFSEYIDQSYTAQADDRQVRR